MVVFLAKIVKDRLLFAQDLLHTVGAFLQECFEAAVHLFVLPVLF